MPQPPQHVNVAEAAAAPPTIEAPATENATHRAGLVAHHASNHLGSIGSSFVVPSADSIFPPTHVWKENHYPFRYDDHEKRPDLLLWRTPTEIQGE